MKFFDEKTECPNCWGLGKVAWKHVCFGPNAHNEYMRCDTCGGTGKKPREEWKETISEKNG